MIKQPGKEALQTWLEYHLTDVGVQHFYLRVEDTVSLQPLLESEPWCSCVTAFFATDTVRDWTGVATRQATHVRNAIAAARRDGLTHLLAIDVDELLFLPRGPAALHRALGQIGSSSVCSLHMRNLEALVPSARCRNPFAEARAFRHQPWEYGAYGYPPSSGKSFGVLAFERLTTNGPHHFGLDGLEMAGAPLDGGHSCALAHGTAVILHYESCTYADWRTKFGQLARVPNGAEKARRFSPYYASSVEACAALEGAKAAAAAATETHEDESVQAHAADALRNAQKSAHALWQQWRVGGYLPPAAPDAASGVNVLGRLGITLIDPPPGAAAATRARPMKQKEAANHAADLAPSYNHVTTHAGASSSADHASASASTDGGATPEDPRDVVFSTSELFHMITVNLDALTLLAAGHVCRTWRSGSPRPPAWTGEAVVAWLLAQDAELIELRQATMAMEMYRLAHQLTRGKIGLAVAKARAWSRFGLALWPQAGFDARMHLVPEGFDAIELDAIDSVRLAMHSARYPMCDAGRPDVSSMTGAEWCVGSVVAPCD